MQICSPSQRHDADLRIRQHRDDDDSGRHFASTEPPSAPPAKASTSTRCRRRLFRRRQLHRGRRSRPRNRDAGRRFTRRGGQPGPRVHVLRLRRSGRRRRGGGRGRGRGLFVGDAVAERESRRPHFRHLDQGEVDLRTRVEPTSHRNHEIAV